MSRFGISEVIRPLSLTKIIAIKDAWLFGEMGSKVEKVADSYKPADEPEALKEVIAAIKHLYAGNSDYTAIEFFTDPKSKKVTHICVCHMRRTK